MFIIVTFLGDKIKMEPVADLLISRRFSVGSRVIALLIDGPGIKQGNLLTNHSKVRAAF